MGADQIRKSSLRRSLQACFLKGVLDILNNSPRRGKIETRFSASWCWMLAISAARKNKSEDLFDPHIARRVVENSGIIASDGTNPIGHQRLFHRSGMKSIPDAALSLALEAVSSQSILHNMEKKHRDGLVDPWDHLLPEDIGSCYELIREVEPVVEGDVISLNQAEERRNSGIHHTPHDVTDFMGRESIRLFEDMKSSDIGELAICDLSVGAGAFLLQISRIMSERTGLRVAELLRENIIGFDIDKEVLMVAGLCFHLQSGCPTPVSEYNLHCLDSLRRNATRRISKKISELPKSDGDRADITIGNPPYVRAIAHEWRGSGFRSENCRNLSAYFLEQATFSTREGGVVSQIVPLALIQSKNTVSIRELLEKNMSMIDILALDCVPGYIFDQGKIGSNSNSAITQRVTIITAVIGKEKPRVRSTRLIRWGSDERDQLFRNVKRTIIPSHLRDGYSYPLVGDIRMKKAFIHAHSSNRSLSEILSHSGTMKLFVPKAIRYFATASRIDLNREQESLRFINRKNRDLAQILINSSFFYWYWRIIGNGFQVSKNDIHSLPLPPIDITNQMMSEIQKMADKLHRSRDRLTVIKSNRGEIRNIKYDLDQRIMQQLDDLVHRMFRFPEHYPFHASKSNNLVDYETLWR